MRALESPGATVNLTPSFESVVSATNEQVNTIEAIAQDLNEDAQALATNGSSFLVVGGVVAVALRVVRRISPWRPPWPATSHIANVATQAAGEISRPARN